MPDQKSDNNQPAPDQKPRKNQPQAANNRPRPDHRRRSQRSGSGNNSQRPTQDNRRRSPQSGETNAPRTGQDNRQRQVQTNENNNQPNSQNGQRVIRPNEGSNQPGTGSKRRTFRPDEPNRQGSSDNRRQSSRPGENRGRKPGNNRHGPGRPGKGQQRMDGGASNSFAPSVPRKARGGIKARSESGEFGKNWWAKRWLTAMERLMDGARLQRGRRYARIGQVLSMNEAEGGVIARVQGSRPAPYKVTIRVTPFSDEQWNQVLDVLADRAIFTATLLAGEMPANIEEAFSTAGVSLFPARGGDLMTECSCPDWANPCKHIAATHYILGDRFDEDPFLIFRLRGRSQEQILQALRQRRAGLAEVEEEAPQEQEEVLPIDADLSHFWEMGPGLEGFAVNVQRPAIPLPLLKRLGEPDFARQYPLENQLGPAYESISQAALILAFSDIGGHDSGDNGSEGS